MAKNRYLSDIIRNQKYEGQNPFTYSVARDYTRQKVLKEFYPTSKYWSRFNVGNEILIGTRGSGKTILLKMLCYTNWRTLNANIDPEFADLLENSKNYIGFYVPLRLRVLREIPKEFEESMRRKCFSFLFNCVSAGSFIEEVTTLAEEKAASNTNPLILENELVETLIEVWNLNPRKTPRSLTDLKNVINLISNHAMSEQALATKDVGFLASGLMEPIISAIPLVSKLLDINQDEMTWLACFDEAEYLTQDQQRVLNTLMRSESKNVALKIATLPLHYTELETEEDGEYIQPGHDFFFRSIDYNSSDTDFVSLTNKLVAIRLSETSLYKSEIDENTALENFIGPDVFPNLISLYRAEFDEVCLEKIEPEIEGILKRKTNNIKPISKGRIKKYKPIYLLRELYKKSTQGNTIVPWLSGSRMVRKITSGNVRRFLQICDALFEASRKQRLTPTTQHTNISKCAEQILTRSKSVYKEGFLLYRILIEIADHLKAEMHGNKLKDIGTELKFSAEILRNEKLKAAIIQGIAYSYFYCPEESAFEGINSSTKIQVAPIVAATRWLHMRAGTGIKISLHSKLGDEIFRLEVLPEDFVNMADRYFQMELHDEY